MGNEKKDKKPDDDSLDRPESSIVQNLKSTYAKLSRIRRELSSMKKEVKRMRQERGQLLSVVNMFHHSRWNHLRMAVIRTKTLWQWLLLPLKIVYVPMPEWIKYVWRNLKRGVCFLVRVRVYRELKWDSEKPLVSVVIPVFNYGAFVSEAVRSAEAQTFSDYEIIIVEGGSTDGLSPDAVASISGPKIRKYFRKERHYPGSNRDFGISKSRGKYIVCLDPDDKLFPTYLEKTVFVAETMGYDIVGCGLKAFGARKYMWINPQTFSLEDEVRNNQIIQSSLFRKDYYYKAGRYKDWSVPGEVYIAEDWEFWVRMMAAGARLHNIQEPLIHYRHHKRSLTTVRPMFSPIEHSEKIRAITQKALTMEAYQLSAKRNSLLYLNVNPLLNIEKGKLNSRNYFSCIPFFALGGADVVYRTIESIMNRTCTVHVVADIPLFPEQKEVIAGHTRITSRVYEIYKMIPQEYMWFARNLLEAWAVKYLLTVHPPMYVYQGGSPLWYRMFPWIKENFKSCKIVDNQFNPVGHVGELVHNQKYIDTVIVENSYMQKFIEGIMKKEVPVRIMTIGVNTTYFRPRRRSVHLLGKNLKIFNLVVTFVGRFSSEKGVDTFLECARKMKGSKVLFVLVGYGYLEEEIRLQIESDKDSFSNLLFVGYARDINEIFAGTDIILVPSRVDGTPVVIKEALASGIPVIGTRVGGIPEMLPRSEKIGYLCNAGDVACMIKHIRDFSEHPQKLASFRRNARIYALKSFTREEFKRRCRDVFGGS
jgi:O-antigen biosynthesis protein